MALRMPSSVKSGAFPSMRTIGLKVKPFGWLGGRNVAPGLGTLSIQGHRTSPFYTTQSGSLQDVIFPETPTHDDEPLAWMLNQSPRPLGSGHETQPCRSNQQGYPVLQPSSLVSYATMPGVDA
jgi:hypothetical protein